MLISEAMVMLAPYGVERIDCGEFLVWLGY